jgi:hypothetical protein
LSFRTGEGVIDFVVGKVGLNHLALRTVQSRFVGFFTLVGGDNGINAAVLIVSRKVAIVGTEVIRQASGILQRF